MATINLVLDKRRQKKDGTYPLILRIIQNRKSTYLTTGVFLRAEDWDETGREIRKTHPNHKLLNHSIKKKYTALEGRLIGLELTEQQIDLPKLTKAIKGKKEVLPTFFEYGYTWVDRLKMGGKVGNARAYENTLKRLETYFGHTRLKFSDINFDFLEDFQTGFLCKGVKQNTIAFYLRTVRTIYNKAIKAKVVARQDYPFDDFRISHESTQKRAVGKEIIQKLEMLELPFGTRIWHSQHYFLLSFYLIGISFVDLSYLKWTDIQDGRVVYKRKKTGKIYNIKLTEKALQILEQYRTTENSTPYILPILPKVVLGDLVKEMYHTRQGSKYCNIDLKKMAAMAGIRENLSTYVSRHSWATIAKSLGYSKDLIAEALGHEYGSQVTGIYLDYYNNEVIDTANERVTE